MAQTGYPPSYSVSVVNPPPYASPGIVDYSYSNAYTSQGYASGQAHLVTSFNDHMSLAIFATLCCFFPLGLAAIIRASEARSAFASQDVYRAHKLSNESKRLSNMAVCAGAVVSVVLIIVITVLLATKNSY